MSPKTMPRPSTWLHPSRHLPPPPKRLCHPSGSSPIPTRPQWRWKLSFQPSFLQTWCFVLGSRVLDTWSTPMVCRLKWHWQSLAQLFCVCRRLRQLQRMIHHKCEWSSYFCVQASSSATKVSKLQMLGSKISKSRSQLQIGDLTCRHCLSWQLL